MLSGRRRKFLKTGTKAAALAAALCATPSYAQDAPVTLAQAEGAPQPSASPQRPASEITTFVGSLIPGFQLGAAVQLAETYLTNAYGSSASSNQDNWLTTAGLSLDAHEHSRRVSLDANYNGQVYYYAKGSQSTQFINNLQGLADVIAIPDYLTFIGRAFAQPVIVSNSGFANAGLVGANGYRNSYGYTIGPDITFRLGDFATSDTLATYGGAYFTDPNGVSSGFSIPGVPGPEQTISRTVSETLRSGTDFSRLQWTLIGQLNELDRAQGLFSEKTAIATFSYALSPEIKLLGTGGYDAISNTTPLNSNLTGPVGMGGVEVTLGPDFDFMIQAGQKYNHLSFLGSLRWNITATSSLTGQATDSVSTPEGQLLGNLSNLTASLNGNLVTANNIYANGSTSSLASFNAQSPGSLSFNQNIARYQELSFAYALDYERDHATLRVFGDRVTQLNGAIIGTPVTNSWGGQASYARNISRLTTGTLGAGYVYYQELGGHEKTYNVNGSIDYSLGPQTQVYLRADYFKRDSSTSLQSLSPFTGSLDDVQITLGLNHRL